MFNIQLDSFNNARENFSETVSPSVLALVLTKFVPLNRVLDRCFRNFMDCDQHFCIPAKMTAEKVE